MPERNGSDRAWADAVAGVIGGVAGILAMEAYWKGVGALLGRDPRAEMQESRREPVAANVGAELGGEEAGAYGPRWKNGLMQAGVYGLLRGHGHGTDVVGGSALGAVLWLIGDELSVPPFVLQSAEGEQTEVMDPHHIHRLAAHLTFGITAAAVSQAIGNLLRRYWKGQNYRFRPYEEARFGYGLDEL